MIPVVAALIAAILAGGLAWWAIRRRSVTVGSLFIWKKISARFESFSLREMCFPFLCAFTAAMIVLALLGLSGTFQQESPAQRTQPSQEKGAVQITGLWHEKGQLYLAVDNGGDRRITAPLTVTFVGGHRREYGAYPIGAGQSAVFAVALDASQADNIQSVSYAHSPAFIPPSAVMCRINSRINPYLTLALQKAAGVSVVEDDSLAEEAVLSVASAVTEKTQMRILFCPQQTRGQVGLTGRQYAGVIQPSVDFVGWNSVTSDYVLEHVKEYSLPSGVHHVLDLVTGDGLQVPLVAFWAKKSKKGDAEMVALFACAADNFVLSPYFGASVQYLCSTFRLKYAMGQEKVKKTQRVDVKGNGSSVEGLWYGLWAVLGAGAVFIYELFLQKRQES